MENKYLFVCYANINRSIVGERICKDMLIRRGFRVGGFQDSGEFDFYVGSAGINPEDKSREFSISMTEGVRNIFIAHELTRRLLKSDFQYEDDSRIVNLHIKDSYDISVPEEKRVLENILRRRLAPYLPRRDKNA
jgi:protein-tyrosine-phosphatase